MRFVEKPITINDVTLNSFEEFCDYVLKRQISIEESYQRTLKNLQVFEEKYGMTSDQFAKTIMGTPAEDEPDFLEWGMEYDTYLELKEELEEK